MTPTTGYSGRVYVVTNELGQETTQKTILENQFLFESLCPSGKTAIYGCSGLFTLNIASLIPTITHVCMFDLSQKVKEFWEKTQKLFQDPSVSTENAKELFIQKIAPTFRKKITDECNNGLSFFSSPERLGRILDIFKNNRFSFDLLDLKDPNAVASFINKKHEPCIIYISNIPYVPMGMGTTMEGYQKFCKSIDLFPEKATLIAAHKTINDKFATQQVLLPGGNLRKNFNIPFSELVTSFPKFPPNYYVLFNELNSNDYHRALACIRSGADPYERFLGLTLLMRMARRHHWHAIKALIQATRNTNIYVEFLNAKEGLQENTALHFSASCPLSKGKKENEAVQIINYLIESGADINATNKDKQTPLMCAVSQHHWQRALALIQNKAKPTICDSQNNTIFDLLKTIPREDKNDDFQNFMTILRQKHPEAFTKVSFAEPESNEKISE